MISKKTISSLFLLLIIFLLFINSLQDGILEDQQQTPSFHRRLLNWVKVKAHLYQPNLDFRGKISNDVSGIEESGAGDQIKEAVAVSLGKGKATVEESAKSAADLAKQKMHQTAQKLMETFSSPEEEL